MTFSHIVINKISKLCYYKSVNIFMTNNMTIKVKSENTLFDDADIHIFCKRVRHYVIFVKYSLYKSSFTVALFV